MYTITLQPQSLEVIITSLNELPAKHSRKILDEVEKQIQKQNEEKEKVKKTK